jgi:NAD-dependent deacetylase
MMSSDDPNAGGSPSMSRARSLLEEAERVCVLTGAGVSAESGVPTFRGDGGLWKSHRAEDLATPGAFRRDPRLVWEWYDWRRSLIADCRPNPGHEALAGFSLAPERDVTLVTQNVDGLHEKAVRDAAGRSAVPEAALPVELHGSIFRVKCTSCTYGARHRDPIDTDSEESLPHCPVCSSLLRPAVVWFGEGLDPQVLDDAFHAARRADVCIVAGTSAVVQPAASIPLVTLERGGRVLEVNPDETPLTARSTVSLRGPSGELLPELLSDLPGSGT